MNNLIYCNDGCQKELYISEMKLGMDYIGDGIERHYLQCPGCSQKYTSYYLNAEMKLIQDEIKTLRKKLPNLKQKQKVKLNKLIKKLQVMSYQLKNEIENGETNAGKLH